MHRLSFMHMHLLCWGFLWLAGAWCHAQSPFKGPVRITGLEEVASIQRALEGERDSLAILEVVSSLEAQWRQEGYLEAGLEALARAEKGWVLRLHRGPVYVYDSLELRGLDPSYVFRWKLDRLARRGRALDWRALEQRLLAILASFQDEGYPFAQFSDPTLDFRKKGPDSLYAHITYAFDPGSLVHIDSIQVEGNHRERDAFVHALTRLYPGSRYDQAQIDQLPRLLNNSIYYEAVAPPEVNFLSPDRAALRLRLKRSQAGKFDLLLGILPPSNNSLEQRLRITGTADILLISPFRFGEVIQLNYERISENTQRLDLQARVPYLFRTPFSVGGSLFLHKQEEDFLNRALRVEAAYQFSTDLSATSFFRNKRASLLRPQLSRADTASLFDQLGGRLTMAGAGFTYERLDYRLTPRKGIRAFLELGLGQRTLSQGGLPDSLKGSLPTEQAVREIDLELKAYYPLGRRHVLHIANRTYWLGQDRYFQNDLRQVGGAQSIRGFDERSLFTNFYTFFSAEYQLMLERDSYIFIFGDYAYLQNSVSQEHLRPRSFGLGMRYGTQAGIIALSYAVGSFGRGDVQAGRGKIHIGLINQF